MRTSPLVAAMALLMTIVPAGADDKGVPAWKRAVYGARAFLGDDGGGVNTVTICDTADRFRDWLSGEHPPGCQTFQHDLTATIEVVTYDPVADRQGDAGLPIAKVRIPSRGFVGYLQLFALHPVIPSGAIVHFKKTGNATPEMFPRAEIPKGNEHGVELGDGASGKVVTYDPTRDDRWELQVKILDGPHAGEAGWMLALGVEDDNGHPVDQFDGAVIEESARK